MQSSTGQYSTHAGEPAQPVQHSVITASSFGFFFRGVASPFDLGSNFSSSGTIPTAFVAPGAAGMRGIIAQYRMGIVELNPNQRLASHARNGTGGMVKTTARALSTGPVLLY